MLDQALEPSLWAMVALTLLLLRFVPLQGWLAVLVAGTTSGLILDTIQFRVGPPRLWDALVCASVLAALLVAALLEGPVRAVQALPWRQAPALNGTNRQHTSRARVAPGARLGIVDLGFQLGDQPREPAVLAAGIDHRRWRLAGAPVRLVRVHPGRQALCGASRPDSQDQA